MRIRIETNGTNDNTNPAIANPLPLDVLNDNAPKMMPMMLTMRLKIAIIPTAAYAESVSDWMDPTVMNNTKSSRIPSNPNMKLVSANPKRLGFVF